MKKLLLLLLLSLGFIGSAYAGDVYYCKYKTIDIGPTGTRTGIISPDITLIVKKREVITMLSNPLTGETDTEAYKILEKDKFFGLTAMSKKIGPNSISILYFSERTKEFAMAYTTVSRATASSGRCTFMYSQ